jgi:hypothetical protein
MMTSDDIAIAIAIGTLIAVKNKKRHRSQKPTETSIINPV